MSVHLIAFKTSNTSFGANQVSISSPGADDPHLQVPLAANSVYTLKGQVVMGGVAGRFDVSVPGGTTATITTFGDGAGTTINVQGVTNAATDTVGLAVGVVYFFYGVIHTSVTAGTLIVRFAQQSSLPTPPTSNDGSWIHLVKIG